MAQRSYLKQNASTIGAFQKILDVALILGLLFLSKLIYGQPWNDPSTLVSAFCAVALFLFFGNMFGLYRSWRVHSIREEFAAVFFALAAMMLGLLLFAFASKTSAQYSRLALGTWWLSLPIVLLSIRAAVRSLLRRLRHKGYNIRTVAIVGSGISAKKLAREIASNDWMGLKVAGFFDNRTVSREKLDNDREIEIKGSFEDLICAAKAGEFDEIYVALAMKGEDVISQLVRDLSDTAVPLHVVPDVFTFNLLQSRTTNLGSIPIVSIYESPMGDVDALLKRVFDVLVGSIVFLITAVPMVLVAIGVKLTSSGPVLFKQRRYGIKGEEIEVWKFRSMTVLEDKIVTQAVKGDARITPFGAFLRRTSLDELPQFINVLQGSMSIVGPRPHAVVHNELYRKSIDGYMLRHLIKPGITGWAQINGWRGETETEGKMRMRIQYDLEYMKTWSLLLDIKIILLTIVKGFINKNAY